jgi:hypothetical protein
MSSPTDVYTLAHSCGGGLPSEASHRRISLTY